MRMGLGADGRTLDLVEGCSCWKEGKFLVSEERMDGCGERDYEGGVVDEC